jgi:filamentous hemagglutinin family protein
MNFNISPICNKQMCELAIKFGIGIFMRSLHLRRSSVFCRAIAGILTVGFAMNIFANPTGMTVGSGTASIHQSGSQLTITASQNALLNWKSFNIAAGETTTFQQPSASSIVWNRINDPNPSQIFGSLQANGIVVLLNSSGFYFGPNSFVSAAGLVVSTAQYAPPENGGGGWEFNGPPPLASIVNYGRISVGQNGSAFLIADKIENHGTIEAPGGSIGLAAGQTVLLSERPDGRGMSMAVTLPSGSVDNYGNLIADAGTIALQAKVMNQDGIIQANSVQNQNGIIELIASDSLTLGANSQIVANGDSSSSGSDGGQIMLQTAQTFSDNSGSQVEFRGGANGGNGGRVLIYDAQSSVNSQLDGSAQADFVGGSEFFYPQVDNLTLTASSLAPFAGFSSILFRANNDITLAQNTAWDLGAGSGQLTLEAGGDIMFGNGFKIMDANNWSVTLDAGYNFINETVQSGQGNIYLNGGSSIQLSQASINLAAGNSIVVSSGSQLIDDGGTIGLDAQVVNQNGLIQANSVGDQHGIIELIASDSLTLGANSQIVANGDNLSSSSDGGQIMLQTAQTFSDDPGSQVEFRGGANGGNGGKVLIYAAQSSVNSQLDGSAQAGFTGGNEYFYPQVDNLTLTANSLAPFAGFSSILFQASGDATKGSGNITLAAGAALDLGVGSGQLTLVASGNIIFSSTTSAGSASITDPNNWSVTLDAGYNYVNSTINPSTGNIYLTGGSGLTGDGFIQTALGNITLTAGQNVLVGKGYVTTTDGGSINVHALAGNIDSGSRSQGYVFQAASSPSQGYYVDSGLGLGGISTAAGGDVSLMAGGNVSSVLPTIGGYFYNGNLISTGGTDGTAGSGAYGPEAGSVTVVAGGNVTGHYLVANGIGSIYAGVKMDANGNPQTDSTGDYVLGTTGSAGTTQSKPNLSLSLISGGWNVGAAQNIILQEVNNPDGDFNINSGAAYHYFDYAPGDYVNLSAGDLVQLGATAGALPRLNGSDSLKVPVIYPPILNVSAGAGGVVLVGDSTYNQLILFPSPQGSLTINTTQSGSLVGNLPAISGTPQIFNLIVSDSGRSQYTSSSGGQFGLIDHAATPVHLGNPTPITLNISGDMSLVLLGAPEAAQINVGGNMDNSRFQGMNLSANDATSINVTGDIINRSAFTSVVLDLSPADDTGEQAPDLSLLAQAQSSNPTATTLETSFYYDPTTQTLTYQNIPGQSLANILKLVEKLNVMNVATATALQNQYDLDNIQNDLQAGNGPPSSNFGFIIGGGGKFNFSAQNMDLGTTAGIQSQGIGLYTVNGVYPLAGFINKGSDISVNLTGNLNMYSTSIASLNGGNINISAGGDVNVGSPAFIVNSASTRGIYTSAQSDVSVIAQGDININGSRIATYDGGSVTVESLDGNVNAGDGGNGSVIVFKYFVNPGTLRGSSSVVTIPGSGILAATFPDSSSLVGNILVETPNGNIAANIGGITQYHLNDVNNSDASVTLLAGYELQDAHGNRVLAENVADGTPVPVLSAQNVVTLGSAIQVIDAGTSLPVSLTQVLDANGNPLLDAHSHPLYVKTLDASKQIVEFVNNSIQPYLDISGDAVNVTEPHDAGGQPINDSHGNPILVQGRNINVSGSGVIAQNASLKATGSIKGLIFAKGNINVGALNNVNLTALAGGAFSGSAGGTISGTIIGIGGINVSGSSIDASLLSNNQISGGSSGQTGFAQGTVANATSQAASNSDSNQTADKSTTSDDTDDLKKKKKPISLAQKVGRVTVLLPTKTN